VVRFPTRGEVARTYDAIADSYDATRTTPWPEVVEFESRLPQRLLVLDLACGSGRHTRILARRHRTIGLDSARELLLRAEKNEPKGTYVVGDMVSLPFASDTFDAAVCVAAVHHLPSEGERLGALAELRRVLRPAGKALLTAWSLEDPRFVDSASKGEADVWVPWRAGGPPGTMRFYHLFREGEFERLSLAAGFHGERFFESEGNWIAEVAKPWRVGARSLSGSSTR